MLRKQDSHTGILALYLPAKFFLLRAPALPASTFQRLRTAQPEEHSSLSVSAASLLAQQKRLQILLVEMSAQPQIEQAIAIASASLHQGLIRLRCGDLDPKQAQKVSAGLLRYLTRMSTRPTPFGLFSGVALGFFGEETTLRLDRPTIERFRSRPDMNWLMAVLKQIEDSSDLAMQLIVCTNQLAYVAGGRVYLAESDIYGQKKQEAVSLRATVIVRKTLELAQKPQLYTTLRDSLLLAFPDASKWQVERLLWDLWKHGLLISTLHPPLTGSSPAHYVAQYLERLEGVSQVSQTLTQVLGETGDLDARGIGGPYFPLTTLTRLQNMLDTGSAKQPQLQVDGALSLIEPSIHKNIGKVAAHAAEVLLNLTPHPQGPPHLQEYRQLFLEKYGSHAEVPVSELLSPHHGLGAPVAYRRPVPVRADKRYSFDAHRERILHTLVQGALNQQSLQVELTEENLAHLQTWHNSLEQAPHSLEIVMQIQAESQQALDRGEFCAVINFPPGSRGGGRLLGRFVDLLGKTARQNLQDLLVCEETLEPEAIFAELSYQSRHARASNIAIRPNLRHYEIAIGTTPSVSPERVIPLSDLVVGVRNNRFYLRSQRHRKRVIVGQLHMLTTLHAPSVCRFLLDIASDGRPWLTSFDWGTLTTAPFLPRVTVAHGPQASIVLSPARWNLESNTVDPQGNGSAEMFWFARLQSWRARWRVPRFVYLAKDDHRLLLDLEHPLMAGELLKALNRLKEGQQLMLQELLPDLDHLWLTDTQNKCYFSEIVVPLVRRDAFEHHIPQEVPFLEANRADPPSHVVSQKERVFFPGDRWSYVKLYCTPIQQDQIIAGPLRDLVRLLREQQLIDRWFFIRYTDPQPHLRLRIHSGTSEQIQPALSMLLSWGRQLAAHSFIQHFTLETYEREVARYGGPMAIDLLEQVFCIDSDLCSHLVAAHSTHRLTLDPLAVAVISLDRLFSAWGYGRERRFQWLKPRVEKYTFRKEFHAEHKQYCTLLSPSRETDTSSELMAQRELLHSLIAPLGNQLPALAAQVRDLAQTDQLWVTEDELLASVAHMHKIRLLDLDRQKEQQLYAFWHHTLESMRRKEKESGKESD